MVKFGTISLELLFAPVIVYTGTDLSFNAKIFDAFATVYSLSFDVVIVFLVVHLFGTKLTLRLQVGNTSLDECLQTKQVNWLQ